MNDIEIKIVDESMWPSVKQLIHDGWNENHIFTKSDTLLKWQYTGYGKSKNNGAFALFDGDNIIGFRLMIPIELMISSNGQKRIVPSGVSTLYYIKPEYRGMKLGLKMQLYVIDRWNSYFAIASNLKTSAPIYKKSGAFMLDEMYRFVLPLSKSYSNIMVAPSSVEKNIFKGGAIVEPTNIESATLERLWVKSVTSANITSLNRPKDFWEWRYLNSPIYNYLFFGSEETGIIVGRICDLYNDDFTKKDERVFRILEFIPANNKVWEGVYDEKMASLLSGVSSWAQSIGCAACEFYLTSKHFDPIFEQIGYKEVNYNTSNKWLDIFSYFEPCAQNRLSNVTLLDKNYSGEFDFNNTYFTLSDADQDRPNVIDHE